MKEDILLFGKTQSLVGIITEPTETPPTPQRPAIILLNAGLIHRVGPNRLYVRIARMLAELGFVVLRFDFSGTGDSRVRQDHLPFDQSAVDETKEAMTYLMESRNIERFLLIGHCSGASFSFMTACADPRVSGIILLNAQGGGQEWATYDRNRKLSQYYLNYYGRNALFDRQKWSRFLRGQVDYRSITRNVLQTMIWNKVANFTFQLKQSSGGPVQEAPQTPGQQEKSQLPESLRSLVERGVQLLFIYSEGSTGLEYVRTLFGQEFDQQLAAKKVKMEIVPASDHLFTLVDSQKDVLEKVQNATLAMA